MTVNLRPPQQQLCDQILASYSTHNVTLATAPTGFGKTQVISYLTQHNGNSCAIAHRNQLVGQMSRTLAQRGIRHRIIANDNSRRTIIESHVLKFGKSYHDPHARVAVASVQTLVNRDKELANWLPTVTMWIGDEGHHYLAENMWGRAVSMFTNPACKGLLLTATPDRTDGCGLGVNADGLAEHMILGPSLRDTIRDGYLVDYKIYAPPSDFHRDDIRKGKTGEFIESEIRDAVAHSSLVADGKKYVVGGIVDHYMRRANGKLGITFVPSIEVGERVESEFNANGIPASIISAKTPEVERVKIMMKFERRQLLQLISVDLIGEGVDVSACEVISMARPTESFALFAQQCGRPLRLDIPDDWHREWGELSRDERLQRISMSAKPSAMIIDHVGNVQKHAVARHDGHDYVIDVCYRDWSLDRRDKRAVNAAEDALPTRTCLNPECFGVYERYRKQCPYCGTDVPPPATRNGPEEVDGDLTELAPEALAALRGEVLAVDTPLPSHEHAMIEYRRGLQEKHTPKLWEMSHCKKFAIRYDAQLLEHSERQGAQATLRDAMAEWAGYRRHNEGHSDAEIYSIFYLTYGVDWMTAMTLHADDTIELMMRVYNGCK